MQKIDDVYYVGFGEHEAEAGVIKMTVREDLAPCLLGAVHLLLTTLNR